MAFTKKVVKAADAVVSPDMTQDQINDAVKAAAASENKVLEVQALVIIPMAKITIKRSSLMLPE